MNPEQLEEKIRELKKGPVARLVEKRLHEFKDLSERGTNEDWFSELCFCVLTANSSARLGIKIQQALGPEGFLELPEHMLAQRLKELGHRFYNIRARFIVENRRFAKIKQMPHTNPREWLVANIRGFGYKEASLPYYERILVIVNGKPKLVEIGKFTNDFKNDRYKNKKLETFAFNPRTLKIEIAPITGVFRHENKGDIFEISLRTGRKVHVTGDHSLFIIDDGRIRPVEVRSLRKRNFIAIPSHLPITDSLDKEINLVEEFLSRKIHDAYVRSKSYCKYLRKSLGNSIKRKNQYTQHFRGIIPLRTLAKVPKKHLSPEILKKHDVVIGFRRSPNEINSIVKITDELLWLLGLMIAEGYFGKNPMEIHQGPDEFDRILVCEKVIKKIFGDGIGIKIYKRKNATYVLKVYNLGFFHFIKNVLGMKGTATNKRVPDIVFSSSFSQIRSFLQGFWEGDGWKKSKSYISITTASEGLANDLMILFLMIGSICRNCIKKRHFTIDLNGATKPSEIKKNISLGKKDVIPGTGHILHSIHKNLELKTKINRSPTKLYNRIMSWKAGINNPSRSKLKEVIKELKKHGNCEEMESMEKLIGSDIVFLPVNEIRKIDYKGKYVYDIEVSTKDEHQNFVGGFGGIFLHNSHFLRNIGFLDVAILDRHILRAMVNHKLVKKAPKGLTRGRYLKLESALRKFAKKLGMSLGELDLYLWYLGTGEVMK